MWEEQPLSKAEHLFSSFKEIITRIKNFDINKNKNKQIKEGDSKLLMAHEICIILEYDYSKGYANKRSPSSFNSLLPGIADGKQDVKFHSKPDFCNQRSAMGMHTGCRIDSSAIRAISQWDVYRFTSMLIVRDMYDEFGPANQVLIQCLFDELRLLFQRGRLVKGGKKPKIYLLYQNLFRGDSFKGDQLSSVRLLLSVA